MAVTLNLKAMPGEVVKLYHAEKAEPYYRQGETPAGAPLTQATADATGLVTFPGLTSRIEYLAMRPNRSFIKSMDSTTRGGSPQRHGPTRDGSEPASRCCSIAGGH